MTETHKEMERLKELLAKTTPGDWAAWSNGEVQVIRAPDASRLAQFTYLTRAGRRDADEVKANADFVAAAHNTMPALLSAYAGMKEALEKIEKFKQKEMPEASRGIPIKERLWPRAQISNMCHIAREALSALPTGEADKPYFGRPTNGPSVSDLQEENAQLRKCLERIGEQRTTAEQDDDVGDIEYGYDAIIHVARTALSQKAEGEAS